MRCLSIQIFCADIRCRLQTKWRTILVNALVLANLGCTGHDNPFDPDNKLGGKPFQLKAETGYGKIMLSWNWPTYPVEGGRPIPIDSFIIFREDPVQKDDTLYPGKQTALEDTAIFGDTLYRYRLTAFKGSDRSDLSPIDSAFAYPLPLDCSYLGANPTRPLGIHFSTGVPTVIGFDENVKFVASGGNLWEIRPDGENDRQGDCPFISNPTSDMALVRNASCDSIYIIVCSAKNKEIDFLAWTGGRLTWMRRTSVNIIPQAIAGEEIGKPIFVADDDSDAIFKINPYTSELRPTKMRTELNPWKLVTLPNPLRLFCANMGSDNVSVFDVTTESLLKKIGVNPSPIDMWLGPDSKLYVACKNGSAVVIIDPHTDNGERIGEILVVNPETGSKLFPKSVTGFADPRHRGVLAVTACSGDPCVYPAFLLYYSLADRKLQRYLKLPPVSNPSRTSFLAKMNTDEGRIYILLYDRIWVCKFK